MLWFWKNKVHWPTLFLLLIAVLPSVIPLFHEGFFVTDDGEWMVIRFSAFYAALHDGQFPVRVVERLNFGYGYPVSTFLYPGFMYLGVLLHVVKIDFVATIKIILGLSMIGSTVFTYLWLKKFFNSSSSLVGAILYTYAPYHLYDLYGRGSVGELLALAILPFILWQIERKSIFFSSLGIAFLVLSHNILAAIFVVVIICYTVLEVYFAKNKSILYFFLISLFFGIGLSAFFWVPILFELQYTIFSSTQVSDWIQYFAQFDLIGYAACVILFSTVVLFITKRKQISKYPLAIFFFFVGIISLLLSSQASVFVWRVMPVGFIQFPFRFLSVSLVSIAFLAAFVASNSNSTYKKLFICVVLIILSVSAYQYINKINYFDKGEGFYSTNDATTTVADEYMPVWVKEKPVKRPDNKVEIIKGKGVVENIVSNNTKTTFTATLPDNALIQINTIYWPGWIAFVDKKQVPISYNNAKGLITLRVLPGRHLVKMNFGETATRLVSDGISFVSLLGLILLSVYQTKKEKKS